MPTIVDLYEPRPFAWKAARVSSSPTLKAASWTAVDYLHVLSFSEVCGPDIDRAELGIMVGYFPIREDSPHDSVASAAGVTQAKLDLNRKYCRIEFLNEFGNEIKTWFGKFMFDESDVAVPTTTGTPTGTQRLYANGLLIELEETIIRSSQVRNYNDTTTRTIGRGITFNEVQKAGGFNLRGNKAASGLYFDDDVVGADKWFATQALQYLLENFAPTGAGGADHCEWSVNGEVLSWYDINVPTDRRSVKAVIDELVDRRRLAGYWVRSRQTGADVTCELMCFTFADVSIGSPGGTIPENTDQIELQVGVSNIVGSRMIRTMQGNQVDRVIVEGERITSTFSLDWDAGLAIGWEPADETSYKAGAAGDEDQNTIARQQESLKDVYSRFIVKEDWNRLAIEHSGTLAQYRVTVDVDDLPLDIADADMQTVFGVGASEAEWWFRRARFLDYLAIKAAVTDEFLRPLVIFPNEDATYVLADQASLGDRQFACTLHMLHDRLGLVLTVNRASGQSLLADNHWAGADDTPDALDPDTADNLAFDYEDMIVTATVQWDDYVAVETVINAAPAAQEKLLVVRINDARLDFEIPGTITDIDEDGALVVSDGKVLRDDRQRLTAIAEACAAWYGVARTAIKVDVASVRPFVELGQLVTRFVDWTHETDVRTAITGISYDFTTGKQSIETSYARLDYE